MNRTYLKITKNDFENFIFSLSPNFYCVDDDNSNEYIYSAPIIKSPDIELRIFSSISKNNQESRDKGLDAIRIVLFHPQTNQIIGGVKHTKRTEGWEDRVKKKAIELSEKVSQYRCPNCKGFLIERKNRQLKKKFLGCNNYPECEFTKIL